MEQIKTTNRKQTRFKTKEPAMYNVIFHNDDVTTMDFVVMVLEHVYHKTEIDAEELMMKVHTEGKAVVGTYYYDIAKSKADYTIRLARANDYPLIVTTEMA